MRISARASLLAYLVVTAVSCADPEKENNINPVDVIKIVTQDTIGVANGANVIRIKAKISDKAASSRRAVTFKTSSGSFADSKTTSTTVEAGSNFIAAAELINIEEAKATVSATAGNVKSNSITVDFKKAYPTAIVVSVDSFAVSNRQSSELIITARLRSENGRPSAGHLVSFTVQDSTGTRVLGAFLNNINSVGSDANGISRTRYSPGGVNYQGYLRITATTKKADSTDIRAATRVFLYRK